MRQSARGQNMQIRSSDVTRCADSSIKHENVILGLLLTSKKILSRAEQLLKLENYKSVDQRLQFSGIKTGSKFSFHRHFNKLRLSRL